MLTKDIGSGYPSDPNTKNWLDKNFDPVFGYPTLARFSWGTITKIFDDNNLDIHFPDEEKK